MPDPWKVKTCHGAMLEGADMPAHCSLVSGGALPFTYSVRKGCYTKCTILTTTYTILDLLTVLSGVRHVVLCLWFCGSVAL